MKFITLSAYYFTLLTIFSTSLFSQTDNKADKFLFINSKPSGVEVYINDNLIGKTPIQVNATGMKNFTVKAIMDSIIRNEFITELRLDHEMFFIMDGEYGLLDIKTSPENAAVYLNDSLISYSNFSDLKLPVGIYKLSILKEGYLDFNTQLLIMPKKFTIYRELKSKFAYLNFSGNENFRFEISGVKSEKNIEEFEIGNYEITAINKTDGKYVNNSIFLNSNDNFQVKVNSGYNTTKYLLYSAFLPGLGQYLDNSKLKSGIIFGSSLLTSIILFKNQIDYNNYKNELSKTEVKYKQAIEGQDIIKYSNQMKDIIEKGNKSAKTRNMTLGILAGIYVINLIDTFIFHNKGRNIEFINLNSLNTSSILNLNIKF